MYQRRFKFLSAKTLRIPDVTSSSKYTVAVADTRTHMHACMHTYMYTQALSAQRGKVHWLHLKRLRLQRQRDLTVGEGHGQGENRVT